MNEHQILDHGNDDSDELRLSGMAEGYMERTAQWARFFATMLFISSFWMVLQFIQRIIASQTAYNRNDVQLSEGLTTVLMIVFTLLAGFHLWSFASRTLLSLRTRRDKTFYVAIESLKSYLKFYGFFLIVLSVMVALTLYKLWRFVRLMEVF